MFRAAWAPDRRKRIWRHWLAYKTSWAQAQMQSLVNDAGLQVYLGASGAKVAAAQHRLMQVLLIAFKDVPLPAPWAALAREYAAALHMVSSKPQRLATFRHVLIQGSQLVSALAMEIAPHNLALAFVLHGRRTLKRVV